MNENSCPSCGARLFPREVEEGQCTSCMKPLPAVVKAPQGFDAGQANSLPPSTERQPVKEAPAAHAVSSTRNEIIKWMRIIGAAILFAGAAVLFVMSDAQYRFARDDEDYAQRIEYDISAGPSKHSEDSKRHASWLDDASECRVRGVEYSASGAACLLGAGVLSFWQWLKWNSAKAQQQPSPNSLLLGQPQESVQAKRLPSSTASLVIGLIAGGALFGPFVMVLVKEELHLNLLEAIRFMLAGIAVFGFSAWIAGLVGHLRFLLCSLIGAVLLPVVAFSLGKGLTVREAMTFFGIYGGIVGVITGTILWVVGRRQRRKYAR
jgi:hypothetical protein